MPCGGIDLYSDVPPGKCWFCHLEGAMHYCHEWDCMLHAGCVIPFLLSDEGKIVIAHGHTVTIWYDEQERLKKYNESN